jgi:hypothetical protein
MADAIAKKSLGRALERPRSNSLSGSDPPKFNVAALKESHTEGLQSARKEKTDSEEPLKSARKDLATSAPTTPQPIKRIHAEDKQPKRRKSQSEIKKPSPSPSSSDQPASLPHNALMGTPRGSGHFQFFISSTVPVRPANEKEFTNYWITVIYPNGETQTILRRFSQFLALNSGLSKVYAELPAFPKKKMIGNLTSNHIAKRRAKLEGYLQGITRLPGIEEFLAFQTFLGGSHSKGDVRERNGNGTAKSIFDEEMSDEDWEETPEQESRRIAMEKRISEVQQYVRQLEESAARLIAIDKAFDCVKEKEDFVRVSDLSKLVVLIGKHLEFEDTEPDFVPKELTQEEAAAVPNVKILSIRQKIVAAISELISKLNHMKNRLVDIDLPAEKLKELQDLVNSSYKLFDTYGILSPIPLGMRAETGVILPSDLSEGNWPMFISENDYWYQEHYFGQEHINVIGYDIANIATIVSLKLEEENNNKIFRLLLRTKDGNIRTTMPAHKDLVANWKEKFGAVMSAFDPKYRDVEFRTTMGQGMQQLFLDYEKKDMRITRKFKFGVLLCKKGQKVEEEMFNNPHTGEDYERFLGLIGDKIELKGWKGFAGGLDVRENTTGVHSYFTKWNDYELMYHVATMLPMEAGEQQVQKKRHLGNDIILLVFQEEGSEPFVPNCVKSNYIQITIVVRVIRDPTTKDKPVYYNVQVAEQADVPQYGPPLPYPTLFEHGPEFKEWLLQKMVNGELSAYKSKLFIQQLRSTYKTLLTDLTEQIVKIDSSAAVGGGKKEKSDKKGVKLFKKK